MSPPASVKASALSSTRRPSRSERWWRRRGGWGWWRRSNPPGWRRRWRWRRRRWPRPICGHPTESKAAVDNRVVRAPLNPLAGREKDAIRPGPGAAIPPATNCQVIAACFNVIEGGAHEEWLVGHDNAILVVAMAVWPIGHASFVIREMAVLTAIYDRPHGLRRRCGWRWHVRHRRRCGRASRWWRRCHGRLSAIDAVRSEGT